MSGRLFFLALAAAGAAFLATAPAQAQQQVPDDAFDVTVERPAWSGDGPRVRVDEAHDNFHTVEGRYRTFAQLLRADGYRVESGATPFSAETLAGVDVLVVANAGAAHEPRPGPVFTAAEIEAVAAWVSEGGALLLIADHAPFGAAARDLSLRFGVDMGGGWVFAPTPDGAGITSQIDHSRANGRMGDHVILDGRDAAEAVSVVRAFTGQSLSGPEGAAVLLRLPDTAREVQDIGALQAALERLGPGGGPEALAATGEAPAGPAQGLAFEVGRGRVAVLGEAGMLTAQRVRFDDGQPDLLFGMNTPGNDNRRFALNLMRWLTRVLD